MSSEKRVQLITALTEIEDKGAPFTKDASIIRNNLNSNKSILQLVENISFEGISNYKREIRNFNIQIVPRINSLMRQIGSIPAKVVIEDEEDF